MKLFICTNSAEPRHAEAARLCIGKLLSVCGAEVCMPPEDCRNLFDGREKYAGDAADCDYVVAVGGDGTVLRAAQTAIHYGKPLLGINNGRVGYLCAATMEEVTSCPEALFRQTVPSVRSLLTCTVAGQTHVALNDVVVTKSKMGVSVEMEILYREQMLASWRGDGVILATPTGSTAYTASAGGPRLLTDLPCMAVTPICPRDLNVRPLVLPDSEPVTVRITERTNKRGFLYTDGVCCGEITDTLTVSRSAKTLTLLTRAAACPCTK